MSGPIACGSGRVLTGISSGPNGSLFIAEFGPAPHRENSARITRWSPNGEFATAEAGFTAAIDVAFDSLGALYVLEFSEPGVRLPNSGRVIRVGPDGSHQVVVSGLNYPTSIAFGPDGNLYVANFGHRSNNGEGEILRVELTTPI